MDGKDFSASEWHSNSGMSSVPQAFQIDFQRIKASIIRDRFWIVAIVLSFILVGLAVTLLMSPVYRAAASVQVDQEAAKVIGTEESQASAAIQDSDRFLKTQLDVIQSKSVATAVAKELRLFNNIEFLEAMGEDVADEAVGALSLDETRRQQVLEILKENMSASLPLDSRIITVTFDSRDPELAAKVANSFVSNYIDLNLKRKTDTSSYARTFLAKQLDEAAGRLAQSEQDVLTYSKRTKIIDASNAAEGGERGSTPQSLVTASLVLVNERLAQAQARRIDAEQRWNVARKVDAFSLPIVTDNRAVQALLEERAKLKSQLELELQRRKDDFPAVQQLKAKVGETDAQLNRIAAGIVGSIRGEYQAALQQENELRRLVAELKSDTLQEQELTVQLALLRRAADTNRNLYDLLLKRFNELNAEAGVQINNVSIVDIADVPAEPRLPNVPLNLLVASIVGALAASLFVLARNTLFNVVRSAQDVQQLDSIPLIGVIPVQKVAEGVEVQELLDDQKSIIAEAYNTVRTSLLLSSASGLPKTMAFVSSKPAEGKSTSCYALSRSIARTGRKVIVIDCDFRKPNQHNMMRVTNDVGMSALLTGNANLVDVIHHIPEIGVDFIACGTVPPDPTLLLTSAAFKELLDNLATTYDSVLIDAAPVLSLSDSVLIGAAVDATLFICQAGANQLQTVQQSISRLRQGRANVVGLVLTKFDAQVEGYSAEYGYGYNYGTPSEK